VVLAAGAGSRFSATPGAKLLSDLDSLPLLAHVLVAVRAFGPDETVVVLGHGADAIETALDSAIGWAGETRIRNPDPGRGLASSLRLGMAALRGSTHALDGAFVVLGDQPRLRVAVMRALADVAAARQSDREDFIVPRYRRRRPPSPGAAGPDEPRNPVLILRPGWTLVDALEGDRGLAGTILARPDRVLEVAVDGDMPDVDEPADLLALRSPGIDREDGP
jgi:molybdenum cofactor cytidylyltransferase